MNTKFAIWRLIVRFEKGGGILTLNLIAITTLHKAVTRDGGGGHRCMCTSLFPFSTPPPIFFKPLSFFRHPVKIIPKFFFLKTIRRTQRGGNGLKPPPPLSRLVALYQNKLIECNKMIYPFWRSRKYYVWLKRADMTLCICMMCIQYILDTMLSARTSRSHCYRFFFTVW